MGEGLVLYHYFGDINGFPSLQNFMKRALLTNATNEAFTHAWNSELSTFQPGESYEMPDFLAAHFALHLTNRELARTKEESHIRAMSPKDPSKSSIFMGFFNRYYKELGQEEMSEDKVSIRAVGLKAKVKPNSKKSKPGTVELTSDITPHAAVQDSKE